MEAQKNITTEAQKFYTWWTLKIKGFYVRIKTRCGSIDYKI